MSEANLEVVFEHLDARRRGDRARLESLLDPDVVHQGVLPELVCHNRDEVLENMTRAFTRGNLGVDRVEMIDAGDRVVLSLGGPRFRDLPWAPPIKGAIHIVFTIRDGRIVRMDDYPTRAQALAVAGAPAADWE